MRNPQKGQKTGLEENKDEKETLLAIKNDIEFFFLAVEKQAHRRPGGVV
jgi:hypothetical protein